MWTSRCLMFDISTKPLAGWVLGSTVDRLRARSSHLWREALIDSVALGRTQTRWLGTLSTRHTGGWSWCVRGRWGVAPWGRRALSQNSAVRLQQQRPHTKNRHKLFATSVLSRSSVSAPHVDEMSGAGFAYVFSVVGKRTTVHTLKLTWSNVEAITFDDDQVAGEIDPIPCPNLPPRLCPLRFTCSTHLFGWLRLVWERPAGGVAIDIVLIPIGALFFACARQSFFQGDCSYVLALEWDERTISGHSSGGNSDPGAPALIDDLQRVNMSTAVAEREKGLRYQKEKRVLSRFLPSLTDFGLCLPVLWPAPCVCGEHTGRVIRSFGRSIFLSHITFQQL